MHEEPASKRRRHHQVSQEGGEEEVRVIDEPEDDSEVKYAAGVESLIMNDGQGRAPGRVSASLDEAP